MSNLSFQSSKKMVQKWYSRRKNKISQKVHKPCNPSKIKGCKYFNKNFSTRLLTVLITGVIVRIEQKNKTTNALFRKGEWAYEYQ